MRILYPVAASLAGAITALSFRPWQSMSKGQITMALFIGVSFAIFFGPWAIHLLFGDGPGDPRLQAGAYYLMASGSNALIPMAVKWLARAFGFQPEDDR